VKREYFDEIKDMLQINDANYDLYVNELESDNAKEVKQARKNLIDIIMNEFSINALALNYLSDDDRNRINKIYNTFKWNARMPFNIEKLFNSLIVESRNLLNEAFYIRAVESFVKNLRLTDKNSVIEALAHIDLTDENTDINEVVRAVEVALGKLMVSIHDEIVNNARGADAKAELDVMEVRYSDIIDKLYSINDGEYFKPKMIEICKFIQDEIELARRYPKIQTPPPSPTPEPEKSKFQLKREAMSGWFKDEANKKKVVAIKVTAITLAGALVIGGTGLLIKGCTDSKELENSSYIDEDTIKPTVNPRPIVTTTPKPTPTPSATVKPSPSPKVTATPSPAPKVTVTPSPSIKPSPTPTPVPTSTPTPTSSAKPTVTPSPIIITNPTPIPTVVPTPTPTQEPTPEPTIIPTPTPTSSMPDSVWTAAQNVYGNWSTHDVGYSVDDIYELVKLLNGYESSIDTYTADEMIINAIDAAVRNAYNDVSYDSINISGLLINNQVGISGVKTMETYLNSVICTPSNIGGVMEQALTYEAEVLTTGVDQIDTNNSSVTSWLWARLALGTNTFVTKMDQNIIISVAGTDYTPSDITGSNKFEIMTNNAKSMGI